METVQQVLSHIIVINHAKACAGDGLFVSPCLLSKCLYLVMLSCANAQGKSHGSVCCKTPRQSLWLTEFCCGLLQAPYVT